MGSGVSRYNKKDQKSIEKSQLSENSSNQQRNVINNNNNTSNSTDQRPRIQSQAQLSVPNTNSIVESQVLHEKVDDNAGNSYNATVSNSDQFDENMYDESSELLNNTAMSLGMDNDELLFNLYYFGQQSGASFGHIVNNAVEETLALHSEGNTPYKLNPANDQEISKLNSEILYHELDNNENECLICRDIIEIGSEITRLVLCKHCFHTDCVIRWLKLQGWCPVCRAPITINHSNTEKHVITSLAAQFEAEAEFDADSDSDNIHLDPTNQFDAVARKYTQNLIEEVISNYRK
mmetsp:Transcript_228/g.195  ORF Transcript_228/g.195 Transcript_228/m.195 type:complete len:292 (-) Transcript_228:16-891(-)